MACGQQPEGWRWPAGHTTAVVELAGCPWHPRLLASLARDGSVRVWDVGQEACLATYAAGATALVGTPATPAPAAPFTKGSMTAGVVHAQAVDPRGTQLLTGGKKGAMHSWPLPGVGAGPSSDPAQGRVRLPAACACPCR